MKPCLILPQRHTKMANVVDDGKDIYYLDMVMKVLYDDDMIIDAVKSEKQCGREKREGR